MKCARPSKLLFALATLTLVIWQSATGAEMTLPANIVSAPVAQADCVLEEVKVVEPRDGATVYLGASVGATAVGVLAEVDCEADTKQVEFFVKRGSESDVRLDTDVEAPYTSQLTSVLPADTVQSFVFTATATPEDDTADEISGTSTISVVKTSTALDADSNGLPDDPYAVLDAPGDRWLSTGAFTNTTAALLAAALVVYGTEPEKAVTGAAKFSLSPPDGGGQSVTVEVPAGLVEADEVGVIIVETAVNLASLVGTVEAADFTREPTGTIADDNAYVAVSLLVSDDDGQTFVQAANSRLSSNPISVTISGLTLDTEKDYVLATHPIRVADSTAGAQLQAATGAWTQLSGQTSDTSSLSGKLSAFGVVAPYYLVDTTDSCADGGCIPVEVWLALLYALSLAILSFADGGVGGGGGPCFIATAAYGTPMAWQIETLRVFRDVYLLDSPVGTALVDLYYRISPPLADAVAASPVLAVLVRVALVPVLFLAHVALAAPWLLAAPVLGWALLRLRRALRRARGMV